MIILHATRRMPMTWQVGLVSVGSDTRNHMVAQKCSCAPKGHRCPACLWGNPLGFADKTPSLSPPAFTHLSDHPCVGSLANTFPARGLAGLLSPALALGTRCVCPFPSYVIDGSHLHGPRRAVVGVAVKPPDEISRRLETAPEPSLTLSLRILYTILILGEG